MFESVFCYFFEALQVCADAAGLPLALLVRWLTVLTAAVLTLLVVVVGRLRGGHPAARREPSVR